MSAAPHHPGRVQFVDGNTGQVLKEDDVSTMPPDLRFGADADGALVPVVRVVATSLENERTIRSYGPAGQLLRTTIQLRGPG